MEGNIRAVLWLESSFFHARCQASSYCSRAASSACQLGHAAGIEKRLRKPASVCKTAAQISADAALKLRNTLSDNPANGEERSDPGSGVGGPNFRGGTSRTGALGEIRGRRTPGAVGQPHERWATREGATLQGGEPGEPAAALMPIVSSTTRSLGCPSRSTPTSTRSPRSATWR